MTRINVLPPKVLTDQHLLAEYRELPRAFGLAQKAGPNTIAPSAYTLGAGHVRFFYSRTGFLTKRQQAIIQELLHRGYNLTHRVAPEPIEGQDADWEPDDEARETSLPRLRGRLAKPCAKYTYFGKPVSTMFYGPTSDEAAPV